MRRTLFLLILLILQYSSYTQNMNKTYEAQWSSVEAALQKGLNTTAQKEIENILKQAERENNTEQYIKALCNYRISAASKDETSELNHILFFKKEIHSSKNPVAAALLHSILGDLYWNYYEENRYNILDRTRVQRTTLTDEDIETWSADDFYQTVYQCYHHSIQNAKELQHLRLKNYMVLVEQGKNTSMLRPTLYDLLIHRAIDFFSNEETNITKPAYAFEIDDEKAFAPAASFVQGSFNTNDTSSQKYIALVLYKEVLQFHLHDEDPSALIDADIQRLQYVRQHSVLTNKKVLYIEALKNIYNNHPKNETAQLAKYYHALALAVSGDENTFYRSGYYQHRDEQDLDYVKAKQLAEEIIKQFPNGYATFLSGSFIRDLTYTSFSMQTEQVVLPQKPSLALLHFCNIQKLYVRAVKLEMNEFKSCLTNGYNERVKLNTRKALREYTFQLPAMIDYKNHSTDVKLEALPLGNYAILLSDNENFSSGTLTTYSFLQVSELAYIKSPDAKTGGVSVYVVHRESGEPLQNVTVKTMSYDYSYKEERNILKDLSAYKTDQDGKVQISGKGQSVLLEVIKDKDDLFLNDQMYLNEGNPRYEPTTRAFLFTDRSIYRPGQTIYFKGILVLSKGEENREHELIQNRDVKVVFYDVNHEVVKEEAFKTNQYGSFTGTFKAPDGLLTGEFRIACEDQSAWFRVEEYKRPKFEVSFDTLKDTYRLNDVVKVKGRAKAYAGNNISDAAVKYTVTRVTRFPYNWCFYRWGMPASEEMVVAHGTAATGVDGSFYIDFKALPDLSADKKSMPVFDYSIETEITDLNGETRRGETIVSVAYQSLQIKMDIPEKIDVALFNELKVETTNMQGATMTSSLEVVMKKLQSPLKPLRSRLWEKADMLSISEADFRRDFPLDEYNDENNHLNWKEDKEVWKTTHTSGMMPFEGHPLESGWYVLEAKTKDSFGEEVMEKKYIRFYETDQPEALPNEPFFVSVSKRSVEPGESTTLRYQTSYPKPYVLFNVDGKKSDETSVGNSIQWQAKEKAERIFNISEADRGGFSVKMWYVKNNRYYFNEENISVPWTNKELKISVETFRDKMLPGSEQAWRLKITGSQKELVAAELLATMYDASLDALNPHTWSTMHLFEQHSPTTHWQADQNFRTAQSRELFSRVYVSLGNYERWYPGLNTWGLGGRHEMLMFDDVAESDANFSTPAPPMKPQVKFSPPVLKKAEEVMDDERPRLTNGITRANASGPDNFQGREADPSATSPGYPINLSNIQLRSNFYETAFFFPQLETDQEGQVILSFKAPDALTRWKMMAYAHTTHLQEDLLEKESVTQKEVMIVPNTPRFFREGDHMVYAAKITNLSDKDLNASVLLQLEDAVSDKAVDELFQNKSAQQQFLLKKGESLPLKWDMAIPENFTQPVAVKTYVSAHPNKAEDGDDEFSDGEKNVVPVLLNSILVTESLPMPVAIGNTKKFRFEKLLNSRNSSTLKHYQLSVEYTANPAWYAVQALPYLTDFPYECAEQSFNRYYANALATHIANANPKVKEIFSSWKEKDTTALLSNLQKNQDLKSALLQETPWVLEAKSEGEQKKNIALLFDLNRMSQELERTMRELQLLQTPHGGFAWFKGMPEDRFVTQYILTGIGRLMHLGVNETDNEKRMVQIISSALPFLDQKIKEDYSHLKKGKVDMKQKQIVYFQIQYLYMRSFFMNTYPIAADCQTAFDYYKGQCSVYWLKNNPYMQAMSAVALQRLGLAKIPNDIVRSLRENAIHSEELGMYYKEMNNSYWWYEAPVETQSMLIECFKEVAMNQKEVDELKTWLLKNKQTMNWKTTKATADACYALLLNGSDWLSSQPVVDIQLGKVNWQASEDGSAEAGSGYVKRSFKAGEIESSMGDISITIQQREKRSKNIGGITWGAVYWQYFENLDKIPTAETPLKLKKELFKVKHGDRGDMLIPLNDGEELQVGDRVKVRIELRVDREMEYVHMKDMRAACFEPQNVLSDYKYQGGLGYFEATKDLATNFFFDHLQKGTYVFEYPIFVTNSGDFSNGIATIQCMYAPEFSSHSEGIRVKVK